MLLSIVATILYARTSALYRVEIHMAGRSTGSKDWPTLAVDEYKRRLRGSIDIETVWHKSGEKLEKRLSALSPTICLDPGGNDCDSEQFARLLFDKLDCGGSRLYIGIGPAEGFSSTLRSSADLYSLSKLTFPHQIVRVLLIEQIYRAAEIRRGSDYHK